MSNKVITQTAVRRAVDRQLRSEGRPPVSDREWQFASEQRWITDEEDAAPEITVNVIEARKTFGADSRIELSRPDRGAPRGRRDSLSLSIARLARTEGTVKDFRETLPNGKPLPFNDVEAWILGQAAADGPATQWATDVPLTASVNPELQTDHWGLMKSINPKGLDRAWISRWKLLSYAKPDRTVECVAIAHGGILEKLYDRAVTLSARYKWREIDAVMFLLTDDVPLVQISTMQIHWADIPCLSRITLTIDPALPPSQVEEIYRRARHKLLEGRYRNISEKHVTLAAFSLTESGAKLSDQMVRWNQKYPQWRYQRVTNFCRDARVARQRLLSPTNISLGAAFRGAI